MIKKAIIGLGNPGKKYKNTRHNIGFIILDSYAKAKKLKFKKSIKFNAEYIELDDTILVKPKTFMNNSGFAVEKVVNFFNIKTENILIIHDDVDLPFSKIRLKKAGGSGGHNGIKSIISLLDSDGFKRMRIGIDKKDSVNTRDYVLQKLNSSEEKNLFDIQSTCFEIIDLYINDENFDNIMNLYN